MTSQTLNKQMVQATLKSLRYTSTPPSQMLDIQLLADVRERPPLARAVILFDRLYEIAVTQLLFYRQSIGIIERIQCDTRETVVWSIQRDFAIVHSPPLELLNWSALFHRYFAPITYKSSELADIAGLSHRQFDRHIHCGIDHLV